MRQGFWKSFSHIALITLTVIGMESMFHISSLPAQESVVDQTGKQTKEPVFRVSKLVEDPQPVQRNVEVPRTANPSDRIANSNSLANSTVTTGGGERNIQPRRIAPAKTVLPRASTELTAGIGAAAAPVLTPAVALVPAPKTGPPPHPLDQAVEIAHSALEEMRTNVLDYTAILAKRESVKGVIGSPSYMNVKFRNARKLDNGTTSPFSIYMKFLKPRGSAGREVIWVDGQNKNNLLVHEPKGTPLVGNRTFSLAPNGFMAMKGQRYPIYKAGLESLIVNLIEKAERDRAAGPCICNYREGANINKRPCSCIELVHPDRRAPYEFHKALVFIDKELNLPVRYAAYDWPVVPGGEAPLIEEYTYYNVKVNVGLTDLDFDSKNPAYKFPGR